MTHLREERLDAARRALEAVGGPRSCGCAVVELQVDGARFAVDFVLDEHEHRSRSALGLGPATNTGLLHALWELPEGVPVRADRLTEQNVATLRDLGVGYVRGTDVLTRTFNPVGSIRSVLVVTNSMEMAVAGVARLPPIFRRLAVAFRRPDKRAFATNARASTGIGRVLMGSGGAEVLAEPEAAIRGVPAVYRWWLAELAYRNWGYVNCAHCVI